MQSWSHLLSFLGEGYPSIHHLVSSRQTRWADRQGWLPLSRPGSGVEGREMRGGERGYAQIIRVLFGGGGNEEYAQIIRALFGVPCPPPLNEALIYE